MGRSQGPLPFSQLAIRDPLLNCQAIGLVVWSDEGVVVDHVGAVSFLRAGGEVAGADADAGPDRRRQTVTVPVLSLRPGESPRLEGEDRAHIERLAESEGPLPPILVERRTMRVIDGMHRLLAASLKGQETVEVEFFDGSPADAFLRAVEANVTHGLPLSLSDRRAAVARIIESHPLLSDRAIGQTAGLSARSVAAIRRQTQGAGARMGARVGRDGRVRPVSSVEGRQRAAALLAQRPGASLREVARDAGVSPATVRDVRQRLDRGEEPVPAGPKAASDPAGRAGRPAGTRPAPRQPAGLPPGATLAKLLRDPSLRHNEHGRRLLRLLQLNETGTRHWATVAAAVPAHSTAIVAQLARHYAHMWLGLARELDERARVIDPLSGLGTTSHT
jgi:transposase-like protein